jgi:ABC-type transport system involved in multi-copper enzyme maturation permease subunit
VYALRAAFVSSLLVWLVLIGSSHSGQTFERANELVVINQEFFTGLVTIQMTLLLLAAPAATAGALCVDKARGTLLHVLVTDLTDHEIVAGKLAARLAPVLGLLVCGLPVLGICTLFGGLEPGVVLGAYLVMFGVAIVSCTLALALSVWARRMHQALLGTYAILGLWAVFYQHCAYNNSSASNYWSLA